MKKLTNEAIWNRVWRTKLFGIGYDERSYLESGMTNEAIWNRVWRTKLFGIGYDERSYLESGMTNEAIWNRVWRTKLFGIGYDERSYLESGMTNEAIWNRVWRTKLFALVRKLWVDWLRYYRRRWRSGHVASEIRCKLASIAWTQCSHYPYWYS